MVGNNGQILPHNIVSSQLNFTIPDIGSKILSLKKAVTKLQHPKTIIIFKVHNTAENAEESTLCDFITKVRGSTTRNYYTL